jgi:hypothetical protein
LLLEEYVENYSLQLTQTMLEKLGDVSKLHEMIDFQKIKNGNRKKTGSLYGSIFKI